MDSTQVAALEALMAVESDRLVVLDLADVTLVNRDAIEFLAARQSLNCFTREMDRVVEL